MQELKINENSGEVRDLRTRNRNIKIAAAIFVGVLILLLAIGLLVYFFVLQNNQSMTLEYIPKPDDDNLIQFRKSFDEGGKTWANRIYKFIEQYINPPAGNKTKCGQEYLRGDDNKNIPCAIEDVSLMTECSIVNSGYGYIYGQASPCVAIKVPKQYGWEPEPFTNLEEAQEQNLPLSLQSYIKDLSESRSEFDHRRLNTLWISCSGKDASDSENIGQLGYYFPGLHRQPRIYGGIPNMYFPYLEQDGYLEPFIFVKFLNPKFNTVINVECKAWAKNIGTDEGIVNFELLIDA